MHTKDYDSSRKGLIFKKKKSQIRLKEFCDGHVALFKLRSKLKHFQILLRMFLVINFFRESHYSFYSDHRL